MPFNPATISGLLGWWKADSLVLSDGDPVTSWADSSVGGNALTQGTGVRQPTYKSGVNGINGSPVVRFDGVDDRLGAALSDATKPVTVIVVEKVADLTDHRTMISGTSPPGLQVRVDQTTGAVSAIKQAVALIGTSSSVVAAGAVHVITFTYSGVGAYAFYIDGTAAGSGTNNQTFSATALTVGMNDGSEFFKGDLAEILIYDSVLGSTDRGSVEGYLKGKYGLSLTLSSPVLASDGKTLTTTIAGGTASGYAITDATGITPHLTSGNAYAFNVASVSVSGSTLTVVLANPIGTGESCQLDIAATSNLTDSGGNTPTGQSNITVTNNSTVTVRTLDAYTDAQSFEYGGVYQSLTGAGNSARDSGTWATEEKPFEFVTDATDIAILGGAFAGTAQSVAVDTGSPASLTGIGFWSAKPIPGLPLAAGKHLVRVSGDYFLGCRLAGGTRSMYVVPTTKRRLISGSGQVGPQVPLSSEVRLWGAYKDAAVDGSAFGNAATNTYEGLTVEFGFTGSGVELVGVQSQWAVSIDGGQPGQIVTPHGYGNNITFGPLAKGLAAGAHTLRAILLEVDYNASWYGVRIVNGTNITAGSSIGDTTLTVGSVSTLAVNDWVKIDDGTSREYRQITNITGSVITVAALSNTHASGATVTSYSAPAGSISVHILNDLSARRLIGMGDSNTQGANDYGIPGVPDANGNWYSFYDPRIWAGIRAGSVLNMEVVNLGIQGQGSESLVTREADMAAYGHGAADRITIWVGTNNINGGTKTIAAYKSDVESLILTAQPLLRSGGRIVLLPVATPGDGPTATSPVTSGGLNCSTANAQLAALATQYASNVVYASDLQASLVSGDYNSLHYHDSGQAKMATALVPYLQAAAQARNLMGVGN